MAKARLSVNHRDVAHVKDSAKDYHVKVTKVAGEPSTFDFEGGYENLMILFTHELMMSDAEADAEIKISATEMLDDEMDEADHPGKNFKQGERLPPVEPGTPLSGKAADEWINAHEKADKFVAVRELQPGMTIRVGFDDDDLAKVISVTRDRFGHYEVKTSQGTFVKDLYQGFYVVADSGIDDDDLSSARTSGSGRQFESKMNETHAHVTRQQIMDAWHELHRQSGVVDLSDLVSYLATTEDAVRFSMPPNLVIDEGPGGDGGRVIFLGDEMNESDEDFSEVPTKAVFDWIDRNRHFQSRPFSVELARKFRDALTDEFGDHELSQEGTEALYKFFPKIMRRLETLEETTESFTFDKFMDATLLKETRHEVTLKSDPIRELERRHRDRPANKTRFVRGQ